MCRLDSGLGACLEEALDAFVPEASDHPRIVARGATHSTRGVSVAVVRLVSSACTRADVAAVPPNIGLCRRDGSEGRARARSFVLACHAIETPRLLLHSAGPGVPEGVANRSGQLGRNLMDHPVKLSWAFAPECQGAGHIIGAVRMGRDAHTSVMDREPA